MNIVCDTMIWYDIASGKISTDEISKNSLNATFINLFEISVSPNILKNLILVQQAVKSLQKFHNFIIEINPFEYIILKQHDDYICIDNRSKVMLKGFEALLKAGSNAKIQEEYLKEIETIIDTHRAHLQNATDIINKFLPCIRTNIKDTTSKSEHKKLDNIPIIKKLITQMVFQFSEGKIEIDIETYPWHEIELFLVVFDNFFKELELIGNSKIQPNDWSDFINTVYVEQNCKYSTNEKTWKRIISQDERIAHYLYLFEYQK